MFAVDRVLCVVIPVGDGIDDGFIDRNRRKFWLLGKPAVRFPVLQTLKERRLTKKRPSRTNLLSYWSSEILIK